MNSKLSLFKKSCERRKTGKPEKKKPSKSDENLTQSQTFGRNPGMFSLGHIGNKAYL